MAGLTSLFNLDPVTQYTAKSGQNAFFQLLALPTTHLGAIMGFDKLSPMEPILTDRAGVVEIDSIFNLGPLTQYAAKSVQYEFSQLVALPPTHLGTIKSFSTHSPIEQL